MAIQRRISKWSRNISRWIRLNYYHKADDWRDTMTINCVWEHNGRDTLLYAVDFVGAYTRGETLEAAVRKMQAEICSYLK